MMMIYLTTPVILVSVSFTAKSTMLFVVGMTEHSATTSWDLQYCGHNAWTLKPDNISGPDFQKNLMTILWF